MRVKIQTMLGDIVVRLYDETPIHRDNFLKLAKEGYYDGTLFHRVIKNFMIQGGDPDSKGAPAGKMLGVGGPDYTLEAEIKDGFFLNVELWLLQDKEMKLIRSVGVVVRNSTLSGVRSTMKVNSANFPSN